MSWTKRVEHPSEVVQKGQEVGVLVLDVDAENKRISLGIKQLQDDPWPTISERFAPGVECDGKVARVQEKGVVVDLGDDIEGFVPASHSGIEDPNRLEEYYAEGDPASLRVIESDAANRRIVLEITETPERKPQEVIDAARAAREAAKAKASSEGDETEAAAPKAPKAKAEAPVEAPVEAAPEAVADAPAEAKAEGAPQA
jgi:small subunit ribosomal protein S1